MHSRLRKNPRPRPRWRGFFPFSDKLIGDLPPNLLTQERMSCNNGGMSNQTKTQTTNRYNELTDAQQAQIDVVINAMASGRIHSVAMTEHAKLVTRTAPLEHCGCEPWERCGCWMKDENYDA